MASDLNLDVQSVAVFEEDQTLVIRIDLPGVSLDRITITKNRREIVVDALLPHPTYHIRQFYRRFDLPGGINGKSASVSYAGDVLELRIPLGWYRSISEFFLPHADPFRGKRRAPTAC